MFHVKQKKGEKMKLYDKDYKEFVMRSTGRKKGGFKLKESIAYWEQILFSKTMELIEITSESVDTEELKKQLLLSGMSCVRKSDIYNNIGAYYCTPSDMSGQYPGKPLTVNFMSPNESGTCVVGVNCVLFRNNPLYMPLYPLIQRYASLLAHADITILMSYVKARVQNNVFVTDDDDTSKQIRIFYQNAFEGDFASIVDKGANGIDSLMAVSENSLNINDLLESRENLMTMYFNDIGIQSAKTKKGNMLTPEIESTKPRLLVSLNDMLKSWRQGAKQAKELFDIDIKVELSDEIKAQFKNVDVDKKKGDEKNAE